MISCASRCVLLVLNGILLAVSLIVISAGATLRFFTEKIVPELGDLERLEKHTQQLVSVPDVREATYMPLLRDFGVFLLVLGVFLFLVTFAIYFGALFRLRALLIWSVVALFILLIFQAAMGGLFLDKDSSLHWKIKKELKDKVTKDYRPSQLFTVKGFTATINIMNFLLECCGIDSYKDFRGQRPVPSCCKRDTMKHHVLACLIPVPNDNFNLKGCYIKLQDKVLKYKALYVFCLTVLLILQAAEIVCAILVIMDTNLVGVV